MEFEEFDFTTEECESFFNKIDEDLDYAFALSLQNEYDEEIKVEKINKKLPSHASGSNSSSETLGIVDEKWEVIDPNPDIRALFIQFNGRFFYGKLDGVEVKWSPRMTLCAGVCSYEGRGGLCSVRLSLPLLKLRPRRDLVETLLHEMIHAYLFVTANNKDHNAHGPEFLKHMNRINKETGTRISVYHSFHDEVDLYRKHWWQCNGPCKKQRPYFGLVKRASNRAPSQRDFWWAQHQSSCGGTFLKIKEPEDYGKKNVKRKPLKDANNESPNIKKFLKSSSSGIFENLKKKKDNHCMNEDKAVLGNDSLKPVLIDDTKPLSPPEKPIISAFSGPGYLLGSSSSSAPRSFLANVRLELMHNNSNLHPKKEIQKPLQKFVAKEPKCDQLIKKDDKMSGAQCSSNSLHFLQKPIKSFITTPPGSSKSIVKSKAKNIGNNGAVLDVLKPTSSSNHNFMQKSIDSYITSPPRSSKPIVKTEIESTGNNNMKVECPVCFQLFTNLEINSHLDSCLLLSS